MCCNFSYTYEPLVMLNREAGESVMPFSSCEQSEVYTIEIIKGITSTLTFIRKDTSGNPISLVGSNVGIKIRSGSTGEIFLTLRTDEPPSPLGSSITYTSIGQGEFELKITDEETATFPFTSGTFWLEIYDSGDIDLMSSGKVLVSNPDNYED